MSNPNIKTGLKVTTKLKALLLKEVWNLFPLSTRNMLSSYDNYYDCNGFITNKQYEVLCILYNKYIESKTEIQSPKSPTLVKKRG